MGHLGHLSQRGPPLQVPLQLQSWILAISFLSARTLLRFLYFVQIAIFHVSRYVTQIVRCPNRTLFKGPLYCVRNS